jgi:hypothetical protein
VLEDLGSSIPEVPLQDFIKFLAPPQPQFDVGATINTLKSDIILSTSCRWAAFDKEPKDQRAVENDVFRPITNIFEKVVDAIIKHSDSDLTKIAARSTSCRIQMAHRNRRIDITRADLMVICW